MDCAHSNTSSSDRLGVAKYSFTLFIALLLLRCLRWWQCRAAACGGCVPESAHVGSACFAVGAVCRWKERWWGPKPDKTPPVPGGLRLHCPQTHRCLVR